MAAELAAEQTGAPEREADFAAPGNPRWMRYLRLRLAVDPPNRLSAWPS